jgi:hypothetical protein
MTQYLVAIHHPDDFKPASESAQTREDISALNREMQQAGIIVFVGGLDSVAEAVSVRRKGGAEMLVTDGPYLETKEHIGGFWILETADFDEAMAWARKGAEACQTSVELREIFFNPAPEEQ